MNRVRYIRVALGCVLLAHPAFSQKSLDEPRTRGLVERYASTKHWALQSIVLISLGENWHPCGVEMILEALEDKDERLRAYAVEALRNTEPGVLRHVASSELVDELVQKQLKQRNDLFQGRVLEVLKKLQPDAGASDKNEWQRWWSKAKKTYAPAEWNEPDTGDEESSGAKRSVAAAFVRRAFDLYQYGLEIAICIDSTGSMQPTIDAARAGLSDLVAMMKGISPRLRLGLVDYKDFGDLGSGAQLLEPLTADISKVQERLDRLIAIGGGDTPERVECGLREALDSKMGWSRGANKVLILIGDAPPHADVEAEAVKLAEQAYQLPFGKKPDELPAGMDGRTTRVALRPFVTSAIGIGTNRVSGLTAKSFQAIAKAGGGAYGELLTQEGPEAASKAIVRYILIHSFSSQYRAQVDLFTDIFFDYHKAGFFK